MTGVPIGFRRVLKFFKGLSNSSQTLLYPMTPFFDFVRGGGPIMIPLLLLSVGARAVIIERLLAFRSIGSTSPTLLPQVLNLARPSF